MKTTFICSVLALTCVIDAAPLRAAPIAPTVEVMIDGRRVELPAVTLDGTQWRLAYSDTSGTSPLTSLIVSGDMDPFIAYSVTLTNQPRAPIDLSFQVGMPYVGGPYSQLTHQYTDSVTDLDESGVASLGLFGQATIAAALLEGVLVSGPSTGCSLTTPPLTQTCFAPDAIVSSVSAPSSGLLQSRVRFSLSAGDRYHGEGNVTLDNAAQVPEPSSLLLLATALVGAWRGRAAALTPANSARVQGFRQCAVSAGHGWTIAAR